jgi:hypothetical protein
MCLKSQILISLPAGPGPDRRRGRQANSKQILYEKIPPHPPLEKSVRLETEGGWGDLKAIYNKIPISKFKTFLATWDLEIGACDLVLS